MVAPDPADDAGAFARMLFDGPGEIRARCRAIDWAATSLGPVEQWPVSLLLAVRLCLDARFPMAVWAGPDLVLIYNEGYPPVLGPEKDAWALGRPAREVWAEVWDQLSPELAQVMRGESTWRQDERFVIRRGGRAEEAFFTYSFTPIPAPDGAIAGALNVFMETTDRVRSLEARTQEARLADSGRRLSEAKYQLLFDSIDEGFFLIDVLFDAHDRPVDLYYVEANAAATRLLGAEFTGHRLTEMDPHFEQYWFEIFGDVARTGRSVRLERYAEPLNAWFDFYVFKVGGPESRRVGNTFRDITDRKRAEQKLRTALERLEEEVRRKNEFLGVLSHELRNPLAPIRNSLYILDRVPPDGDQARRAREVIARQAGQLTHLVDDLLDVTRISRGKVQLQRRRCELNELVGRAIDDHRVELDQARVAVELRPAPEPVFVDADWTRITQVVGNLLVNAAKFAPGGHAWVEVATDAPARQAVIRVRDDGEGMSRDLLSHVFEPFMQADASLDRVKGGLGLGLALAKGIVAQHGGAIEAKSEGVGRGSEFTVRLPLEVEATSPGPPADTLPPPRRRVLLVEDNRDAASSLAELLVIEGHDVAVAYHGAEAMARARSFAPDLLLCDIGLPGMDGFAVARAFRADEALRHTRLVALSGYARPEDRQRSAAAGFDAHMAKPPSLEKLREVLARLC